MKIKILLIKGTILLCILSVLSSCANNAPEEETGSMSAKDSAAEQTENEEENEYSKDETNENINPNTNTPAVSVPFSTREQLPFEGISGEPETIKTGNIPFNSYKSQYCGIVCPNPDNSSVYFVNIGNDNFLYEHKNGKSELILEETVKDINYWEGCLYFIKDDNKPSFFDNQTFGEIYKYDIDKKELSLFKKGENRILKITEEGVFFESAEIYNSIENDDKKTVYNITNYIKPFDGGEAAPFSYVLSIDKYSFKSRFNGNIYEGYYIINNDTGEQTLISSPDYSLSDIYIYNNKLFFTEFIGEDVTRYFFNLLTGEKVNISFNAEAIDFYYPELYENEHYTGDIIELNGIIYSAFSYSLCVYDYESDNAEEILLFTDSVGIENIIKPKFLYTDGEKIYAAYYNKNLLLVLGEINFIGRGHTEPAGDKEFTIPNEAAIVKELFVI